MIEAQASQRFRIFEPWRAIRALARRVSRLFRRRRIQVPPMSEAWLLAHERESSQRQDL